MTYISGWKLLYPFESFYDLSALLEMADEEYIYLLVYDGRS